MLSLLMMRPTGVIHHDVHKLFLVYFQRRKDGGAICCHEMSLWHKQDSKGGCK